MQELDIDFSALFMVQPSYSIKDFNRLYKFIKDNQIDVYTLSIFTPMKGTKDFEREKLTIDDPKKFDFLHLVMEPKLPRFIFYLLFYWTHIRLLKSKRIRKYLLEKVRII